MPKQAKDLKKQEPCKNKLQGVAKFKRFCTKLHANAKIFEVDPPLDANETIVVIAAYALGRFEMMIWGVRHDGSYHMQLLKESYRVPLPDHRGALAKAGYKQVGDVERTPRSSR